MSLASHTYLSTHGALHADVVLVGSGAIPWQVSAAPESQLPHGVHDRFLFFLLSRWVHGLVRIHDMLPDLAFAEEPMLYHGVVDAVEPVGNRMCRCCIL